MNYVLVLVGGGFGSLARYAVGTAIVTRMGRRFPFGSVAVNITGCFLIGLLMTLLSKRVPYSENFRLLLVVGFLGGYTTFSSFEWETYAAVRGGSFWLGTINVVGSVALGYAAVWLGSMLVRR